MVNDIRLQESHPVDENLRPLKVGGKATAIETAQSGNGARITGGLEVSGTGKSIVAEPLITNNIRSANLYIVSNDDIVLDATGENILFKGSAGDGIQFKQHHTGTWDIVNLTQDKDIVVRVNDGGASQEIVQINGAEPYIIFPNSSAGFSRKEQTFSTTDVKGTSGTDDTDIDFRKGNKFRLEMTGDIAQMNLIFPTVSGNFLLVCTTDGDHDVTAWKVWESDESAATTTDVMWAGGSVPAFTSSGIDIVSFYWDADEQQAYGIASLAFATP